MDNNNHLIPNEQTFGTTTSYNLDTNNGTYDTNQYDQNDQHNTNGDHQQINSIPMEYHHQQQNFYNQQNVENLNDNNINNNFESEINNNMQNIESDISKKRKQEDEFLNTSNKKTKSDLDENNNNNGNSIFQGQDNALNDQMQDEIQDEISVDNFNFSNNNIQLQENITIIENPNEEELKKIKEKKDQLRTQKKQLLLKNLELINQECSLIDKFLEDFPIENKTIPEPIPVISLPPIKSPIKPKKKPVAVKKTVIKKETTTKKDTKPKKDTIEKKKPKKDTTVKKEAKKDTPAKKDTSVKKETKKEVKKETKKETKKEVKREAPKKTTKPKPNKTKKFDKCKEIITTLMNDKFAFPFNAPVDPVLLLIPEYPNIIKEPMDFGTIKRSLETGKYTEVAEFVSDVELVFDNCWKFNGIQSDIGSWATHLSELYKKISVGLIEEDDDDFTPSDPKKKKTAPKKKVGAPTNSTKKKSPAVKKKATPEKVVPPPTKTPNTRRKTAQASIENIHVDIPLSTSQDPSILEATIKNLSESLKNVQEEMKKIKQENNKKEKVQSPPKKPKNTKTPTPKVVKKKPKKEDVRPMTFKEKQELSMAINNLDSDHLGEVVKIISERMPELTNNTAPDEIEIDIDALDAITLRHLERFVRSCNAKKRKKRESRDTPESLTVEDKQLKVIEAAHATSSSIRDLERELASMEGRPVPPPIDVPLSLPVKKTQRSKKNQNQSLLNSDDDSISDSDLMSVSDENDELQIVPTNLVPNNPSSVSFDVQSGMLSQTHLLSSNSLHESIQPKRENIKKDNNVVLKNFDQWNLGDDNSNFSPGDSNSTPGFDNSGDLWKKLQNRETINKQKEREREMLEEKIKQEKERQEREKREKLEQIEREKRENERRIYEEQQRERLEQERLREEERLRTMQELEQSQKTVDLQDHDMIENFEKSLGLPYN